MKRTIFVSGIFLSLLFFQACIFTGPSVKGDGHVTKESRQVSGFENLDASTGLIVFLIPDSSEYVVVEADENLHDHIKTKLDHKTLKVFTESRIRWAKEKNVLVHFKKMVEIKSSSGAIIRSQAPIRSADIELRASSGSRQHLEIEAKDVEAQCSSGAHIDLVGKCEKADLKASSGAHLKGEQFLARHCEADASSGAHIWIKVSDELNAEASSGGHIYYSGNPSESSVHSSSGGSVSQN